MRIYSKILSIFAATSALAFSLENNNVKREVQDQCTLGIAQFDNCFFNYDVNQLCSEYNSDRCQNFVANPIAAVPACQSLSEEKQNQVMSELFSKIILKAGIASVSCAKNEYGSLCSYAPAEHLNDAEKLRKAIKDSSSSKACADNASWALQYMLSDGGNVNNTNQEMANIVKEGLQTLKGNQQSEKKFFKQQQQQQPESNQNCLKEIAQYQSKCFQGNDINQLCGNYNSSECQTYLADPMSVLSSCQSLPEEEQKKIRSEAFSNIILDAGVAAVSCAKNEHGSFCSYAPSEGISSAQKLRKAIDDSAASKACSENAVWALKYMIADGENANNTNQEMTQIVNEGLKKLQDKKTFNPSQQCLDDIAQYQSKCFQGNDVDQLCGNYNSSECQAYLANPMSVLTSCQSLSDDEKKKIQSESFSNIILDAGVAAVSCAKNEEGAFCSNVAAEQLTSAQKLTKAIEDSAASKACTDNAIWALEYMVADGENANNKNQEMVDIVKSGLQTLKGSSAAATSNGNANEEQCRAEIAKYQSECFQNTNGIDQLCANMNSDKCRNYVANPMSVLTSCQSLPEDQKRKIRSEAFSNIILDAGVASISCVKNEYGSYCSYAPSEGISSAEKLNKAINDSASSKICTENAIFTLKYMLSDGEQANNTNQDMVEIAKKGLETLQQN